MQNANPEDRPADWYMQKIYQFVVKGDFCFAGQFFQHLVDENVHPFSQDGINEDDNETFKENNLVEDCKPVKQYVQIHFVVKPLGTNLTELNISHSSYEFYKSNLYFAHSVFWPHQ
jgi:hypothetical protein